MILNPRCSAALNVLLKPLFYFIILVMDFQDGEDCISPVDSGIANDNNIAVNASTTAMYYSLMWILVLTVLEFIELIRSNCSVS
ncbi:unnamed protein product [Allacma fusca]|uniref:Uncharacterized protein n=1 Tax=Allacma fusca TaxID=39272 RepID=A0A8J2JUX1_9HEXA|nr:unnamed protein product [Allacma fusca]